MEFPPISVVANENLKELSDRISKSFAAVGIELLDVSEKLDAAGFARVFVAVTPAEVHIFFLCPFEWNGPREERIFPKLFLKHAAQSRRIVFHLHAAYPLAPLMAYHFADAQRFYFGIELMMALDSNSEVSAERVPLIAGATAMSLTRNYPGIFKDKPSESWLKLLDEFVLQHLRTEKDSEKPDEAEFATTPVIGVGCLVGEIMRILLQAEHKWSCRWTGKDAETLLEVGVLEKKGFFAAAEHRTIVSANPIQKAFKLFQNGAGDSMESMYRGTVAIVKAELEKKK